MMMVMTMTIMMVTSLTFSSIVFARSQIKGELYWVAKLKHMTMNISKCKVKSKKEN